MKTYFSILYIALFFPSQAQAQLNIELRDQLFYGQSCSNIWGYTAPDNTEYALVGTENGLSIVDISDPDNAVEVAYINEPNSFWKEIKTYSNYAYITNETGGGLHIVDLSNLPGSVSDIFWTANDSMSTAHTLWIDDKGRLFLFGYNNQSGSIPYEERGAMIADITNDPMNPQVVGIFEPGYIHDGYVRNDTLWASLIGNGFLAIYDVSDPSNVVAIAEQNTPFNFTHNAWPSNDGKYVFTTDEVSNAYIASYDVNETNNIKELDRWRASPGSGLIPHNSHVKGNFLVNSYYKYGINILDITHPDNLIETGHYDTSPFPDSDGFAGCWGVYPYFPSGTIVASDIEEGLFVLTPDYRQGCYLEGLVTDQNAQPVSDVKIEILGFEQLEYTDLSGEYKGGIGTPGMYDVRFSRNGCVTEIIKDVVLSEGIVTVLNESLDCDGNITSIGGIVEESNWIVYTGENRFICDFSDSRENEMLKVELFDVSGRLLAAKQKGAEDKYVIFEENLPSGIYIIRATGKQSIRVKRVVKEM